VGTQAVSIREVGELPFFRPFLHVLSITSMVPNHSSVTDTSHSRLARPRRSAMSVPLRNAGSQQKLASDSLSGLKLRHTLEVAPRTKCGGQMLDVLGTMRTAGDVEPEDRRFDTAHGFESKHRPRSKQLNLSAQQRDANAKLPRAAAPRRRPSFGSLLGTNAFQLCIGSETALNPEFRNDLYNASTSLDVGVSLDAEMIAAGFGRSVKKGSVTSINEDNGEQCVDHAVPDVPDVSNEQAGANEKSIGLDTDDWLSLHASDLIRRIQVWSDALSTKETQLNARILLQEQRERRFRGLRQTSLSPTVETLKQER
jgi:hypothetical protein